MKIQANAKINLTLDILGKRPDGYHDLVMIMQSVGLHDVVTVSLNDSGRISVKSEIGLHDGKVKSISALPVDDESNIAYKAAKAFFDYAAIEGQGVSIGIEKNIPMEAGMAGGSADGAAVIVALNRLCGTGYSDAQLWEIGVKVGADIPFCITGGTMLSEGKGEILSPLPQLADFAAPPVILLCKPEVGVSTGKAYGAVDGCDPSQIVRPDTEGMKRALAAQDSKRLAACLGNVFEQVLQIAECEHIKEIMREQGGALGACMTGSGTTVFGIFDDEDKAASCAALLKKEYAKVYLTRAESCGCKEIPE